MVGGLVAVLLIGETMLEANSTLSAEVQSTSAATPTPESTPQTRVFIPAVGGDQRASEQDDVLTRVLAWLDEGYRGFLLLLLALAALVLLRGKRGEGA
jgi:hypothetical protein